MERKNLVTFKAILAALTPYAGPAALVGLVGVAGVVYYQKAQEKANAAKGTAAIATVIKEGSGDASNSAPAPTAALYSQDQAAVQNTVATLPDQVTTFASPANIVETPITNNPPVMTGNTVQYPATVTSNSVPTIAYDPNGNRAGPVAAAQFHGKGANPYI